MNNGTALGIHSPGTAYVLLHHYMGDADGNVGTWGLLVVVWAPSQILSPEHSSRMEEKSALRQELIRS